MALKPCLINFFLVICATSISAICCLTTSFNLTLSLGFSSLFVSGPVVLPHSPACISEAGGSALLLRQQLSPSIQLPSFCCIRGKRKGTQKELKQETNAGMSAKKKKEKPLDVFGKLPFPEDVSAVETDVHITQATVVSQLCRNVSMTWLWEGDLHIWQTGFTFLILEIAFEKHARSSGHHGGSAYPQTHKNWTQAGFLCEFWIVSVLCSRGLCLSIMLDQLQCVCFYVTLSLWLDASLLLSCCVSGAPWRRPVPLHDV